MQIRIRATGQVLLEHEWIKWVATTYAKSISAMTADIYDRFDSDAVFEGAQATGGTVYQYSQRDGVEQQSDGKWYTKYILGPVFVDGETAAAEQEAAYKAQIDATTRAALILQIDDESDALIRAVIGERGHEYELAEKEALAFKASGYTGLVPSSVQSWATAKGWTATQSADSIIAASVGWRSAQAALRASRLLCKEQAKNAANAIDMGIIRSGWAESLAAIKESLN